MPSCAVINFSSGSWYPRGQQRLLNSLSRVGFEGAFLGFDDVARLGCPPHQQVPYGFKPYMFNEASKFGFELVLWCDASVWAVRPVDTLFRQLQHEGHVFFENTITGQWASDASLRYFGVSRDIAFTIPMLHGLCMGLDLRHPRSQKFLKLWTESLPTFPGAWTNERQQVSRDPRVSGHRHDQTAASILAWQLEMPFISGPKTFLWHPSRRIEGTELDPAEPHHDICFYAQGM